MAVGALPDSLARAGLGSAAWGQVVCLVVGLGAGAAWYWLYPRPLAERLLPACLLLVLLYGTLAVASPLLSGGREGATFDTTDVPGLIGWAAVVVALVLCEGWHRARDDSRDETRRLRGRDEERVS